MRSYSGSIPLEIEIAHQHRVGRHRRHLALGPARRRLRMSAAPCAAFVRRARMDVEQRLDLRHPRRGAQVAQVHRVESHRSRALGHDDRFERALLNAVLSERAVLRQHMVARRHDWQSRQNHRAELPAPIDQPAFRRHDSWRPCRDWHRTPSDARAGAPQHGRRSRRNRSAANGAPLPAAR